MRIPSDSCDEELPRALRGLGVAGLDYGWLCDGEALSGYDFASGRRAPPRSKYGLNHFDRNNWCRQGGNYKEVTWKLDLPDGKYQAGGLKEVL